MRRAGIIAGVVGIAAALAWQATAATGNAPTVTEANPGAFPDRAYVLTLPKRQPLTTGQVKVTENGEPVDTLSVLPAGSAVSGFATILVIDASNSMKGAPITNAMAAGRVFASKKPPNAQVGVITFNDKATVRLAPTRDRKALEAALGEARPRLGKAPISTTLSRRRGFSCLRAAPRPVRSCFSPTAPTSAAPRPRTMSSGASRTTRCGCSRLA